MVCSWTCCSTWCRLCRYLLMVWLSCGCSGLRGRVPFDAAARHQRCWCRLRFLLVLVLVQIHLSECLFVFFRWRRVRSSRGVWVLLWRLLSWWFLPRRFFRVVRFRLSCVSNGNSVSCLMYSMAWCICICVCISIFVFLPELFGGLRFFFVLWGTHWERNKKRGFWEWCFFVFFVKSWEQFWWGRWFYWIVRDGANLLAKAFAPLLFAEFVLLIG